VANLSKALHTDFYQNRSTFAEVMHKTWCVLMSHSVVEIDKWLKLKLS